MDKATAQSQAEERLKSGVCVSYNEAFWWGFLTPPSNVHCQWAGKGENDGSPADQGCDSVSALLLAQDSPLLQLGASHLACPTGVTPRHRGAAWGGGMESTVQHMQTRGHTDCSHKTRFLAEGHCTSPADRKYRSLHKKVPLRVHRSEGSAHSGPDIDSRWLWEIGQTCPHQMHWLYWGGWAQQHQPCCLPGFSKEWKMDADCDRTYEFATVCLPAHFPWTHQCCKVSIMDAGHYLDRPYLQQAHPKATWRDIRVQNTHGTYKRSISLKENLPKIQVNFPVPLLRNEGGAADIASYHIGGPLKDC